MDEEYYDDLLNSLIEDCSINSQNCFKDDVKNDMEIETPLVVEHVPVTPKWQFNCVEDNDTYYPDIIGRRRYGGYKPPKSRKVIFIDPFAKKVEQPIYSKQLHDSMERLRLRENDKRDSKIKYIKKKYGTS